MSQELIVVKNRKVNYSDTVTEVIHVMTQNREDFKRSLKRSRTTNNKEMNEGFLPVIPVIVLFRGKEVVVKELR